MRFFGIDIASKVHVVAVIDADGVVLLEPTKIEETGPGHERLLELLGDPSDSLVVMEATGHYWQNAMSSGSVATSTRRMRPPQPGTVQVSMSTANTRFKSHGQGCRLGGGGGARGGRSLGVKSGNCASTGAGARPGTTSARALARPASTPW